MSLWPSAAQVDIVQRSVTGLSNWRLINLPLTPIKAKVRIYGCPVCCRTLRSQTDILWLQSLPIIYRVLPRAAGGVKRGCAVDPSKHVTIQIWNLRTEATILTHFNHILRMVIAASPRSHVVLQPRNPSIRDISLSSVSYVVGVFDATDYH